MLSLDARESSESPHAPPSIIRACVKGGANGLFCRAPLGIGAHSFRLESPPRTNLRLTAIHACVCALTHTNIHTRARALTLDGNTHTHRPPTLARLLSPVPFPRAARRGPSGVGGGCDSRVGQSDAKRTIAVIAPSRARGATTPPIISAVPKKYPTL